MNADRPRRQRAAHAEQAERTILSVLFEIWVRLLDVAWAACKLAIPFLAPLALAACLLPLLALFSLGSGWMVWKSVPAAWQEPIFLLYGDGIPRAETVLQGLVADQAYNVALELLVPATQANYALGNFMTTLILSTATNKTVAVARKPSVILPPSKASLFSLTSPTTVHHRIQLLSQFVPGASRLLATVEIGRKDMWRSLGSGEAREITVFEARLIGDVQLSGLRALIGAFPALSAIVSAFVFFAFSVLGVLAFWIVWSYLSFASRHPRQDTPHKPSSRPTTTPKVEFRQPSLLTPSTTSDDDEDEVESSSDSTEREMVTIKSEPEDSASTSQLRRRLSQPLEADSESDA